MEWLPPDPLPDFPSALLVGVGSSVAAKAAGEEPKNRLSRIFKKELNVFKHMFPFQLFHPSVGYLVGGLSHTSRRSHNNEHRIDRSWFHRDSNRVNIASHQILAIYLKQLQCCLMDVGPGATRIHESYIDNSCVVVARILPVKVKKMFCNV